MSVQKVKVFEDESFEVCVHINGTLLQDITFSLNSVDGSAIGMLITSFTYVHV